MNNENKNLIMLNLVLTALILVGLVISGFSFTKGETGSKDIYKSLLSKLEKHEELTNYSELYPRITRLDQPSIEQLVANELNFYENASEGDYLLEYLGMIVIYDSEKDKIISFFEQERIPDEMVNKLFAHEEAANHMNRAGEAVITKLDDQFLNTAKENNATFFQTARNGDYLFEWDDLTLVYNYEGDVIVNFLTREALPADFGQKLFAHPEVADHVGTDPTITRIDDQFLETMRENSQEFFNSANIGDYLLEWSDLAVIYDYATDSLVNILRPQQAPADLLTKLTSQPGLESYATETPRVSIVTADVLPQLLEQFPNIYTNAEAGNYVVRYADKLVIFDYNSNAVVDSFDLVAQE
ncbi:hypothetical protein HQ529_05705 [Candidatus Woesearchaeota archaeon]|nr:hypothetical protein [Candidatus Woesearchaeota archaeon]